ncbi:hypothetical protein [Kribbella sp. NPDC055071]
MRAPGLPLALAYARRHLLMCESEVSCTKERLGYFARVAGFALGAVYVEEVQSCPASFEALIHAALLQRPRAILVPSLLHLAVLGAPTTITRHVERLTGAQVIVVTDPAREAPARRA